MTPKSTVDTEMTSVSYYESWHGGESNCTVEPSEISNNCRAHLVVCSLVDTGCSTTIVYSRYVAQCEDDVYIDTCDGSQIRKLWCLIDLVDGVDGVLGVDVIDQLGGVTLTVEGYVLVPLRLYQLVKRLTFLL
ncbi:hypothetical protein SK128_008116 [Halocaridina rubra]|uniref:Uncharacterized protein n=1 Tax=Halocaridina rubra TaxID=373956 RepID=A0AAN8WB08_HALRR